MIAGENVIARIIASRLIRESEVPRPEHISPEQQNEIYTALCQLEEAFVADLESADAITPERLGAIRSRFGVIQVEMMRSSH